MNEKPTTDAKVIQNNPNPACKQCKTAACENCPTKAVRDVPKVSNYSQCKRAALQFLGDSARVWQGDVADDGRLVEPAVMVGIDQKPGRLVLGFGDTFQKALELAVISRRSRRS